MMTQTLVNSPEVDALASQIEVYNLESIVSFGAGAADEISKCSDVVLNSMNLSQLDDSSAMLNTLAKIMDKFDIEEIKENPGLFGKLFGNLRKQLDKILAKYHTMGDEVDKIYVQLKQYEADIKQSNRKLEEMFQANVNYYHELVRYILAGEQGCRELEAYIAQRQAGYGGHRGQLHPVRADHPESGPDDAGAADSGPADGRRMWPCSPSP